MNILHLQTELNLTCGITKSIYLITKELQNYYNQYVFTLGGDGINRFDNLSVEIINLNLNRKSILNNIKILIKIFIFCKKNKIDIIHSHHRYFDFLSYIISRFLPVQTICSVHSKVHGLSAFSYKSKKIVAVSQSVKNHLLKNFNLDEGKIVVINNFVDPAEVIINKNRNDLKKSINISPDCFVIGFVGRFSIKEKGVDILLKACKNLNKTYPTIYLLMVGDGEDIKFVEDYFQNESIRGKITPPQNYIFDFYNIIDIVVLPSRVDPFPLTMLEAGLMKKPFIGSSVDGIADMIENNVDGLLFEPGNVDDLTDKIKLLIADNRKSIDLAEKLYKKVCKYYSTDNIIPKYKDLYNRIS
jgi:L-malate glycosyltransferase